MLRMILFALALGCVGLGCEKEADAQRFVIRDATGRVQGSVSLVNPKGKVSRVVVRNNTGHITGTYTATAPASKPDYSSVNSINTYGNPKTVTWRRGNLMSAGPNEFYIQDGNSRGYGQLDLPGDRSHGKIRK
jgi:hypothetical protein